MSEPEPRATIGEQRCEYLYGYHPVPMRCDNAAQWIMTDEAGKETRFCHTHRECNEGDGDWRHV